MEAAESVALGGLKVSNAAAAKTLADAEAVTLGLTVVSLPSSIQKPFPSVQQVDPFVPIPQQRLPSSQAVSAT